MTAHVVLPWPPTATSANASGQGRWRRKCDAARSYKATCAKLCMAGRVPFMDAPAVDVTVIFCPPRNGRFDLDNLLGRAKQGLDAFAEAIGVDDGQWRTMTLERGDKTAGGAVHVYATPSTWQSLGCVTARLRKKRPARDATRTGLTQPQPLTKG